MASAGFVGTKKIVGLLKSLPKEIRRYLNPISDYAKACLQAVPDTQTSLLEFLVQQLNRMTGLKNQRKRLAIGTFITRITYEFSSRR